MNEIGILSRYINIYFIGIHFSHFIITSGCFFYKLSEGAVETKFLLRVGKQKGGKGIHVICSCSSGIPHVKYHHDPKPILCWC